MASTCCVFNPKQFYETLASSQNISNKLNHLKTLFEKCDIPYIFQTTTALQQVLHSNNELPLTKYNALLTLQLLLLTSSYPALMLAEIYILPILFEIAVHQTRKRTQEDTQRFFIEKGYRDTIGIRKVSRKYVLLAVELIFCAAVIKPQQNVLNQQLQTPSRFAASAAKLKQNGVAVQQNVDSRTWQVYRLKYLRQLKKFQPESFAGFVNKRLREEIVYKQVVSVSLKKLIDCEDCFITIPIINICVGMLSDITHHFPHKKHYLALLNSFVKQADIYAVIVVHNSTFVKDILDQIISVRGDQSLSYGKLIYPQVDASLQQKLDFYCEIMRCIQTWAECLPLNEIGQISQIKGVYTFLKHQKRFLFPDNLMLNKIVQQFQQALNRKSIRNDKILKIIQNDSHLMSRCLKVKSFMTSVYTKDQKTASVQPKSIKEKENKTAQKSLCNNSFEELLKQVGTCLSELTNQKKIHDNMYYLRQFLKEWENLKESCKQEISKENVKLGDTYHAKISAVYPYYIQLKRKSILFSSFQQKVSQILSNSQPLYDDYGMNNNEQSKFNYKLQINQSASSENSRSSSENQSVSVSDTPTIEEQSHQQSSLKQVELGCWSKRNSVVKDAFHPIKSTQKKSLEQQVPPNLQLNEFEVSFAKKPSLRKQKQNVSKSQDQADNNKIEEMSPKIKIEVHNQNDVKIYQGKQHQQYARPQKTATFKQIQQKVKRNDIFIPSNGKEEEFTQNQYGIRQLLKKRKEYLNGSKNDGVDSKLSFNLEKILPSDILDDKQNMNNICNCDESSISLKGSSRGSLKRNKSKLMSRLSQNKSIVSKQKNSDSLSVSVNSQKITQKPIPGSNKSIKQQKVDVNKLSHSQQNNSNQVYQVYQIKVDNRQLPSQKTDCKRPKLKYSEQLAHEITVNNKRDITDWEDGAKSYNSRHRHFLQKIAYSSTNKAIMAYKEYVSKTNSRTVSNRCRDQLNGSHSSTRSIIKRQYNKLNARTNCKMDSENNSYSYHQTQSANCSYSPILNSSLFTERAGVQTVKEINGIVRELNFGKFSERCRCKKQNKLIRNCLKNKGILFEDCNCEIGFVHFRKDNNVDFTLYFTAKTAISLLTLQLEHDESLIAKTQIQTIKDIQISKQQIIKIQSCLKSTPFRLPNIKFNLNLTDNQNIKFQVNLPCSFNKFLIFKPLIQDRYSRIIQAYQQGLTIKSKTITMNSNVLDKDKIHKFLPNFNYIRSCERVMSHVAECFYQSQSYIVQIISEQRGKGHILGRAINRQSQIVQFLVYTFQVLLGK